MTGRRRKQILIPIDPLAFVAPNDDPEPVHSISNESEANQIDVIELSSDSDPDICGVPITTRRFVIQNYSDPPTPSVTTNMVPEDTNSNLTSGNAEGDGLASNFRETAEIDLNSQLNHLVEKPAEVEERFIVDGHALQKRGFGSEKAGSSSRDTSAQSPPRVCNLPEYLNRALISGKRSDLTLVLGDEKDRLPVHCVVLAARSSTFAEMLQDIPSEALEMHLPNVNPQVFKTLVDFIYTDDSRKRMIKTIPNTTDTQLLDLWDLAEDFKLPALVARCTCSLTFRLKVQNVLKVHQKAIQYNERRLEAAAFKFILKKGAAVLKTAEFLELSFANLCKLVECDWLICSELEIFQAVIRWGTALFKQNHGNDNIQSSSPLFLREVLKKVVPLIRFPLMTSTDIAEFVVPSQILTPEELLALFSYVCVPDEKKPEFTLYNVHPRLFVPKVTSTSTPSQSASTNENNRQIGVHVNNIGVDAETIEQSTFEYNLSMPDFDEPDDENGMEVEQPFPAEGSEPIASTSRAVSFSELFETAMCTGTIGARKTPKQRKQRLSQPNEDSDDSDTTSTCRVQVKKDCEEDCWDGYVRRWVKGAADIRESTASISLENVKITNFYSTAYMPTLHDIYLDLVIPFEDGFKRFAQLFDVRRFVFFEKDKRKWKLEELWDMNVLITVIVNGVTMLKMNRTEKELTISFQNQNDSNALMSGLRKSFQLQKLNLVQTEIPSFEGFPTRWLQQVVLYNVRRGPSEFKISDFVRKCLNLTEFSCWVHILKGQHFPGVDLTKDLVSGDKLTRLALSRMVLTFVPKTVKLNLTELYLDCCIWSTIFASHIHLLFPALKKLAIKMHKEGPQNFKNERQQPNVTPKVTARLLANISKLPDLEWIRIWGMDWTERHEPDCLSPGKNLRNTVSPISEEEIVVAKNFLFCCGLREDVENFLMKKDPITNEWKGTEMNDAEPKEDDHGFWDLMDQLEFKYFQLHKVYKDYKLFQDNFEPLE